MALILTKKASLGEGAVGSPLFTVLTIQSLIVSLFYVKNFSFLKNHPQEYKKNSFLDDFRGG